MKNSSKRLLSVFLAALMASSAVIPVYGVQNDSPDGRDGRDNRNVKSYVSPDGNFSVEAEGVDDLQVEQSTGMPQIPASAEITQSGDGYTVYKVTDPEEIAALLEAGQADAASEVPYYEIEDYEVNVIVGIEGSSPLFAQNLGVMVGGDFDLAAIGIAQNKLLAEQQTVINRIENTLGENLEVTAQYSVLTNGFALKAMASEVSEIAGVEGVRYCYIAPEFTAAPVAVNEVLPDNVWQYYSAASLVEAEAAWEKGYTGAGTIVGVIDSGAVVDHNAFATAPDEQKMTIEDVQSVIDSTDLHAKELFNGTLSASDVYYNGKIVYKFDYADKDTNVKHSSNYHGNHVAGIVAGYDTKTTETDAFAMKGAAYDAQLAIFKVFGDQGTATFVDVVAAMEDAILLKLDAVNLSLGAAAMGTYDEGLTEVFDAALQAGVAVYASAGNSYDASYGNAQGKNQALTKNVDNGVTGIPSNYESSLSVASLENMEYPYYRSYALYGERSPMMGDYPEMEFYDPAPFSLRMTTLLGDKWNDTVYIDGYGDADTIAQYDVKNKLVLIFEDREEQSVTPQEVYDNLAAAGAAGMIYASQDEEEDDWALGYDDVTFGTMPFVTTMRWCANDFLSYAEENPDNAKIYFYPTFVTVKHGGEISDYSSRGTTVDLTIKPEITAVGGNVYSSYNGKRGYAVMSGTSMASPQTAGGAMLVKQYLLEAYPDLMADLSPLDQAELVNRILLSTANPVLKTNVDEIAGEEVGYWPVRAQGAGLMDLNKATSATTYLSVNGDRPTAELGDDPQRTGVYEIPFSVTNFGSEAKTYSISTVVQTEDVYKEKIPGFDESTLNFLVTDYTNNGYRFYMTGAPKTLDAVISGASTVTVAPGETISGSVTVTLTDTAKKWMDTFYPTGGYVEGFVFFEDTAVNGLDLSMPYLGFYGDFTETTIMDNTFYQEVMVSDAYDFANDAAVAVNSVVILDGDEPNYLGNAAHWNLNPTIVGYAMWDARRNYISPNGDGFRDAIEQIYFGQMRYADSIHYSIVDNATNAVYYDYLMEGVSKNIADDNGDVYPTGADAYTAFDRWAGTDADGNLLPDGTVVTVSIEVTGTFAGREKTETWSFPVRIDTKAPDVTFTFSGSGTNLSFNIVASDEGMISDEQLVMVGDPFNRKNPNEYVTITSSGILAPVESELVNGIHTTRTRGSINRAVSISYVVTDYAYNTTAYYIVFDGSSIDLGDTENLNLIVGDTYELVNTADYGDAPVTAPLTWSSNNSAVASVKSDSSDSNRAVVTAKSVGTAVITVNRPGKTDLKTINVTVCPGFATITASAGENGSISVAGVYELPYGEEKTYTITPDEHYVVADVLVDGVSVGAVTSYTFKNETEGRTTHTIEASFTKERFDVTFVDWDDSVLKIASTPYGEAAEAPVNPTREHYTFLSWDTDFSCVTSALTVKATYVPNDVTTYYAIAIIKSEGGSITGPVQVEKGGSATYSITPDAGYILVDVLVDDASVGAVTTYTLENVDACHTIMAKFHKHAYTEKLIKEPTCTEQGIKRFSCSCGDFYETAVSALGHDLVTDPAVAPTCTSTGLTEGAHCTRCSFKLERQTVPALNHLWDDGTVFVGGIIYTCRRCGDTRFEGAPLPIITPPETTDPGLIINPPATEEPSTPAVEEPVEEPLPFIDVTESDWFYDAVKALYGEGLMVGVSENEFAPEAELTRAMVVTILHRMEGKPAAEKSISFSDVADGAWYSDAVKWAASVGIVLGNGDGTFAPDAPVSVEQLAAILNRYADYKDVAIDAPTVTLGDDVTVSDWAVMNIRWALSEGLLRTGLTDATIPATRAEVAYAIFVYLTHLA